MTPADPPSPDEVPTPKPSWTWSGGLLTVAALGYLGDAVSRLGDRVMAVVSPLAASTERGDLRGVGFWALVAVASLGLLLRRNWARRLLLGLTALRAIALLFTFGRVLMGGAADLTGWVFACAALASHVLVALALIGCKHITPTPPPPVSRRRLAAVALALLLCVGVVVVDFALPAAPVDVSALPIRDDSPLAALARHPRWSGERVEVIGFSGGAPTTRVLSTWQITVAPAPDGLLELTGFHFAQNVRLAVDVRRDILVVHDTVFVGEPVAGRSPLFGQSFEGVKFSANGGRVSGSASILALADGRFVFDFDKVVIDGRRSREYGSAAPVPP